MQLLNKHTIYKFYEIVFSTPIFFLQKLNIQRTQNKTYSLIEMLGFHLCQILL